MVSLPYSVPILRCGPRRMAEFRICSAPAPLRVFICSHVCTFSKLLVFLHSLITQAHTHTHKRTHALARASERT
eukprot:6186880-Pleurochrysis_carterae.AAC.1